VAAARLRGVPPIALEHRGSEYSAFAVQYASKTVLDDLSSEGR
jgi:hypothetical protein